MTALFRTTPEGGFLYGDPELGLAGFAYPSSPYAYLAQTEPENMARLLLEMAEAEDRYWRKAGVADHMREAFFNRRKTLLAELLREDGASPAPATEDGPKRRQTEMATNVMDDPKVVKALAKAEAEKAKAVTAETKRCLAAVKEVVAVHAADNVNAKTVVKMLKTLGADITTSIKAAA